MMILDEVAFKVLNTKDYSKLPLWIPKVFLSQIFLWPKCNKFHLNLISPIAVILITVFIIYGLIRRLFEINSIYEFAYIMELVNGLLQTVIKCSTLFYYSKELKTLLNEIMEKFWPYDLIEGKPKRNIMNFYSFMNILIFQFAAIGILFGPAFLIPALIRRNMAFPVKYSFDWSLSPIFEIMAGTQIIGYQINMYCVMGTDLLFVSIGTCMVIQYRLLQQCLLKYYTPEMIVINKKLKNFGNDNDIKIYDERKHYFIKCVKHHQMLQRFTKSMNKIFNVIMLFELSSIICGIGLAIIQFARTGFTTNQLYVSLTMMVGYSYQLLIYCATGEMINNEAKLLPHFIYHSNWRDLRSRELQRDVIFFIHNAQEVPAISAFNIFELNMETYLKVIKMSFSLYTFMKTIAYK